MRDSDSPGYKNTEITYDPTTERSHLALDPEHTPRPSLVVVHFIAHVTNKPQRSLPPLQSVIDTDTFDRWLSTTHDPQSDAELTFAYAGYQVTLDTVGNLWAQPTNITEEHPDETSND